MISGAAQKYTHYTVGNCVIGLEHKPAVNQQREVRVGAEKLILIETAGKANIVYCCYGFKALILIFILTWPPNKILLYRLRL